MQFRSTILKAKLARLDEWNRQRHANAEGYRQLLDGLDLVLPNEPQDVQSVYHLFVVRTPQRDQLREHLRAREIFVGIHYPIPLHLQPSLIHLGYSRGEFPNAERAAEEVLSLPMYAELNQRQLEQVAQAVREFFN